MGLDSKKDVHLDGSSVGAVSRLEVLEGPSGRRVRSEAERARIAAESLLPGAQVSEVARKHGATRWQVYDWRRRFRQRGELLAIRMTIDDPEADGDRIAFSTGFVSSSRRPSLERTLYGTRSERLRSDTPSSTGRKRYVAWRRRSRPVVDGAMDGWYDVHTRLAAKNGLVVRFEKRNKRFDGLNRDQFDPRFRSMSDDDARTRMVAVIHQKA